MQTATQNKLATLLALIATADAFEVDGSPLLHSIDVEEVTGEPENEILHASWESDGNDFSATFTERGLSNGYWQDGNFRAVDSEGEMSEIVLYKLNKLDPMKPDGTQMAQQFFQELLDSVETLSGIAEVHGERTLADLFYLQTAILKNTSIEHIEGESEVLNIAKALASGNEWVKYIDVKVED